MIKLVLVDDHQMFLDGMVAVLSSEENFDILFVENNAKKALLKLHNSLPDLIITDISMPDMNGIEFIKLVKKDFPEVKILVLSTFDNMQSFKDIHGFLKKDVDTDILINTINEIVLKNEKHFEGVTNNENILEFNKSLLTEREKEIIQLIGLECTTEEIASKLCVSKHTIEAHRKNIFEKMQVKNIAGLIKRSIHLGIVK
jgi:DNA-binding NarL/FixJ family response regulator